MKKRKEQRLRTISNKEIKTLHSKLDQIESEKSWSYKREDKTARQLQSFKQDVKNYSKENTRLQAQLKAFQSEKEKILNDFKECCRQREIDTEKHKDLEQRIFQLIYEKDSIMEMLATLERSIPSSEIKRLFSDYINNQKELFSMDENKTKLENELLLKEKELRSLTKKEQLSENVINLRKEIEQMRKELSTVEGRIEAAKAKISSLKDELHCVEIHERRRNEVIFETERNLLDKKDENEILKREINYLTNAKHDIEKAYGAICEEKKLIDRELYTLRSQIGSNNHSILSHKPGNFTSTLNPGDYIKNKIIPTQNYDYSSVHMMNPNENSSFVSGRLRNTYSQNYFNKEMRDPQKEEEEDYETENEQIDQINEQSFESDSNYCQNEEMAVRTKLQEVKEAFNSIRSSMKNNLNTDHF